MRITTQMLNESARKAGLPINNTSLLNYIKNDEMNNSLLEALNKDKEIVVNSSKKNNYEKLDKEADELTQSAEKLLQEGEKSLFEQAKINSDNTMVYESIENLFEDYNSTLTALRSEQDTMNCFYRQMLMDVANESKDDLLGIGITFQMDGTASVNMEKVKSVDMDTLEQLLGKVSNFVNKVAFLSPRISNNAEANVESLSSAYNASGNPYAMGSSKYDFWG